MMRSDESRQPSSVAEDVEQKKKAEFLSGEALVVCVVAFYFVTSIALVLLNKVMFSEGSVGVRDAPLFLTWTQIVVAVLACLIIHVIKPNFASLDFFPFFEFDFKIALQVMPLTFMFLGMIIFNNLCLKYVEVSFYQVARSLSIVCNIIFSYTMLGQTTSRNAILSCVVVILGFWLGCSGEVNISFFGVFFGVISSVFVALYSIYIKKVLPAVGGNTWKLLIYNNMNSMIAMPILIILAGEVDEIGDSGQLFRRDFWVMTLIVGVFGFLINISTFLQVKYTSPLTHNVSGTAKACVQTLIGLWIWQNPVTSMGMFGTFLSIIGCFVFGAVRYYESLPPAEKAQASESEPLKLSTKA